jgi:hypothetical protein
MFQHMIRKRRAGGVKPPIIDVRRNACLNFALIQRAWQIVAKMCPPLLFQGETKRIRPAFRQPLAAVEHCAGAMDNQTFHLKHFLALLLALIPLAVVVGACVTCP